MRVVTGSKDTGSNSTTPRSGGNLIDANDQEVLTVLKGTNVSYVHTFIYFFLLSRLNFDSRSSIETRYMKK